MSEAMTESAWARVGVVPLGCGHVGYQVTGGGPAELTPVEVVTVLRAAADQVEDESLPPASVSLAVRLLPTSDTEDGHVRVQVFAGPDEDHRANCGTLTMRHAEARVLLRKLGAETA